MTFQAIEFGNANEAIQHNEVSEYGDAVIRLNRKYYVVKDSEVERLEAAGVEFAFVCDHEMQDGTSRLITIPVN